MRLIEIPHCLDKSLDNDDSTASIADLLIFPAE